MADIKTTSNLITGQKVWLVDGNQMNRERLQHSLSSQGYIVNSFEDIATALKQAVQSDRFVLVTAEQLPDGYFGELISSLKNKQKIVTTIVTSLDGTIERAVDAFRHGAQDYLVEPYSSLELNDVIQRALSKAKKQEELAA